MINLSVFSSRRILIVFSFGLFINSNAQNNYNKDSLKSIKSNYMTKEKMKVEIWSDIMCPFCYIGKRQFEEALKQFSFSEKVEIVWRSFMLDPTLPKPSSKSSTYAYLANRKGISLEQSISLHRNVANMAKGVGLDYNFDIAVVANSFDAHRLIQLAKTLGLGDQAEERLFKAYFSEGKDMCDVDILIDLGKEIGIPEVDLNQLLISDRFANEIQLDIDEAQRIGVTGVPFFVFNRQYAVSGAQGTDVFKDVLSKSFADWEKAITELKKINGSAAVCTPESGCE